MSLLALALNFRSFVAVFSFCVLGVVLFTSPVAVRRVLPLHPFSINGQHSAGTASLQLVSETDTPSDQNITSNEVQSSSTSPYSSSPWTVFSPGTTPYSSSPGTVFSPGTTPYSSSLGTTPYSSSPGTVSAQNANSDEMETPATTSKAFLGFVDMGEQLSATTSMFFQLSYFSAAWNLSMIEPWIDTSSAHMSSLPPINRPQVQILLFYDIYNKTALEMHLTKCFNSNLPKPSQKNFVLHSLNEALIYSPRDVLIVLFKTSKWTETMGNGDCDSISGATKTNVLSILNYHVQKVKDEAQKIHGREFIFKIWKTVCITAIPGVPFSMKNATFFLRQQLASKQRETNKSATVVLPHWKKVKAVNPYGYYYDPNFKFNEEFCQLHGLPYSSKVLIAVDRMMERKGFSEHFISVYVRTEKLCKQKPEAVKQCLDKFPELLESTEKMYKIPRTRVVLVHDAGKYGSNTFNGNLRSESQKILSFLESLKLRAVHYDPDLNKDLPQNRIFVAAVEQEFLSQSHVLLTLGNGGFMMNTRQRFISRQGVDRAYSLCDSRNY